MVLYEEVMRMMSLRNVRILLYNFVHFRVLSRVTRSHMEDGSLYYDL